MSTPTPAPLTVQQRQQILQRAVATYVQRGYRVLSQTETAAQLVRPKSFSCFWATAWTLLFGIGLVFYLIWYAAQKDETVYLTVDERGKLHSRV